jgi:ABC-type antimicrobial peptide transport system permease subunit
LALAGLVSGYIQHAWERRVDLRVLDVMGKRDREWLRTFAREASGLVLVPVATGGIGGLILGYILTAFLNPLVFGWQLRFELGAHAIAESLSFVVISVVSMVGGGMLVVRRVRNSVGSRDE